MRKVCLFGLAWCTSLYPAVIRGTVMESSSGHPLAQSLVVAEPVAGTPAAIQSVRTNPDGQFEFTALPAGAYLLTASRRGFAPAQYGQKRWKGSGVPVVLQDSETAQLEIRLQRFGSITGTILDENGVGLAGHDVVAFRNSRPPVMVARAVTDDLGMYHLWGLEPGSYVVRTMGKEYDEGSYLPTFSRETARLEEAYATEVELDKENEQVEVQPFPGRLYSVAGRASVAPQMPVVVTLTSEMGSVSVTSDGRGNFRFPPLAPGSYELYAATQGGRPAAGINGAYQSILVYRERNDYRLSLEPLPELRVETMDNKGQPLDSGSVQMWLRRKDLSGQGKSAPLRASQILSPGRWELAVAPNPAYYASAFSGPKPERDAAGRADGWNEIELAGSGPTRVQFVLCKRPTNPS